MPENDFLKFLYVGLAAIAGAVTALSFTKWRELTRMEIGLTLFVGFSFAIFVTPWLAHVAFGLDTSDPKAIAGLTYAFASGSNSILPVIIRKIHRSFTGEDL